MQLQDFVQNIYSELEPGYEYLEFNETTQFQELDDWDSLTALMVLDMIDDKYEVSLTGDELKECVTIDDLYSLILKKK